MRNLRSTLIVLVVFSVFALGLVVFPTPLHQALSRAKIDGTRPVGATAASAQQQSATRPSQGERTAPAGVPNGPTSNVIALTADGRLHSNLSAVARTTSLPGPGHALGNGSTTFLGRPFEFQFAAQGDPFDAQGNAFITLPGFINTKGRVDCLDVVGSKAYLSGPIEHQIIPGFERWFLYVEDNDLTDKESGTPDRISVVVTHGISRPDCTDPFVQSVAAGAAFTFSKGRVEADQER